jgi:hypothetical protein
MNRPARERIIALEVMKLERRAALKRKREAHPLPAKPRRPQGEHTSRPTLR